MMKLNPFLSPSLICINKNFVHSLIKNARLYKLKIFYYFAFCVCRSIEVNLIREASRRSAGIGMAYYFVGFQPLILASLGFKLILASFGFQPSQAEPSQSIWLMNFRFFFLQRNDIVWMKILFWCFSKMMFIRLFKLAVLIFNLNRASDWKNKNLLGSRVFHNESKNLKVSWKTKEIMKFFCIFLMQVAAIFIQCNLLENWKL